MLPDRSRDFGEERTNWVGSACMHAMICALQTTSVSTNDIRCQTDRASKDRQLWTIFWTSTAASRSALKHANDCYLHVVHHAGSLQHRATKSLVGRGTATFDLCLRTPLAYIFRDLHCIARASVQHGGKKHVSSPPRWCETTQRTGKKSGHGNGLRTLLRTFVRI
jgi:hypothetical protein